MKETILTNKKHGMPVLLLVLVLYIASIAGCIWSAIALEGGAGAPVVAFLVVTIVWMSLGWIFLCGLKVLKPQEALVLTLFGKYIGTLKGEGFY